MPNSKYGTFRNRTEVNTNVTIKQSSEFIEKSASSVEALRESTSANIKAVIISEQKEGGNETILFTYAKENVQVGEFITFRKKTYLVYGQYEIIFSEEFKKHKLIECNIEMKFGPHVQKAYYISSLRRYSGLVNLGTQIPYEFSSQKPILVTKANEHLKAGVRFIISGEGFIVNDLDKFSNPGLVYAYIEKSTIFEDIDDKAQNITNPIPKATAIVQSGQIVAGEDFTITTNFAHAVFSHDVDIISKSTTQVVFEVPIGINEITVETKNESGDPVITIFKVVI